MRDGGGGEMRRKLFNFAAMVSLVFWFVWLILNLGDARMSDSDPDHTWYCWGVAIPRRFFWLVRYSLLIWCVLGVLPSCYLIVRAYRGRISRRTLRRDFCVNCRYDLTGNISGVCPECGTAVAGKVGA